MKTSCKPRGLAAVLTITVVACFVLLILLPLGAIFYRACSQGASIIWSSLSAPEARHSFWLTLWLTLFAVVCNTLFGTIIALVLVNQRFRGRLLLQGLLDMPFAVSPVVAGLMFVLLLGPKGWCGALLGRLHIQLIYALPGMAIATLFITLPFVAREVMPVLQAHGREQTEAAHVLGASGWQTFFRVTLPNIKWGLAYGVTLTIARSIGEFGAVLVVSGSIINKTQSATLYIHDQFTNLNYAGSFSAALVLACFSFVLIICIQALQKKQGG